MTTNAIQWGVFAVLTVLMALATWWQVRRMGGRSTDSTSEYFLAGRNLSWPFARRSGTSTPVRAPGSIRARPGSSPTASVPGTS
jgi:hypothetical protein